MSLSPAGWYPDPDRAGTLRWYDGTGWTEHRSPAGGPVAMMPAGTRTGMGTGAKVALILGSVFVGLILLGVVASIAIPVFLNQRAQATLAGLDAVTCEQLATEAVRVTAADAAPGAVELLGVTATSVVEDRRPNLQLPSQGEVLVLTCAGTAQLADGFQGPVLIDLTIDVDRNQRVQIGWAQ